MFFCAEAAISRCNLLGTLPVKGKPARVITAGKSR
jgi:hypothetical protein